MTVGVIAGVILMVFVTKRVFSVKIEGEKSPSGYKKMKDIPTKTKKSRSKQRSTKTKSSVETAVKATNAEAEEGSEPAVAGEEEGEEDESMLAMWNGNKS